MTLTIVAETVPLEIDIDGVARVGKTRVTLDTILSVFKQGETAEGIVERYPTLKLADVYGTIAYYLNHQQEVEAYLQKRRERAEQIKQLNQTKFPPQRLRDRLLSRQKEERST